MSPPLPKEPVPTTKGKKRAQSDSKRAKSADNNGVIDTKVIDNRDKDKVEDKVDQEDNDGWEHYFDEQTQRFFFFNTISRVKQWLNPRVSPNDECNQNLPTFDPPNLPFEKETLYEQQLRLLKSDEEFQKLSTFEKYKRVEALKAKLNDQTNEEAKDITSTDLQHELKDIKPFNDDVNFNDYGSKSLYAQELNQSIKSLNNGDNKNNKNKHKVTKQQIKQFNDKKKQNREDKLKKWLTND